jgi:hypothetical protein
MTTRRDFLAAILAASTAPVIVHARSIMPIAAPKIIVRDPSLAEILVVSETPNGELALQWFIDGVPVPGATGRTFRTTLAMLDGRAG